MLSKHVDRLIEVSQSRFLPGLPVRLVGGLDLVDLLFPDGLTYRLL